MSKPKKNPVTKTKKLQKRPTIGLLSVTPTATWSLLQWQGMVDACREQDVNLIFFPGGGLRLSPEGYQGPNNYLYDLVSTEKLDGLVVWTSTVGSHCPNQKDLEDFFERFQPLPIVSLERPLADHPTIVKDDYQSMRQILTHLIEVHDYRRIAFLLGTPSDPVHQARYRAYTDILAEYELPFDANLVFEENMLPQLDERHLQPGTDFEVLASSDDEKALAALQVLQERGIRVPEDVALTGHDDHVASSVVTPPLTTVHPQYRELGRKSTELILALIAGEEVPQEVVLPTKLVIRRSCGCAPTIVKQPAMVELTQVGQQQLSDTLAANRERILAAMAQTVGGAGDDTALAWSEQLLDSFVAEARGETTDVFWRELEEILRQVMMSNGEVLAWQKALSVLWRLAQPYLESETLARAENLSLQGQAMIGEISQRARGYQAWQSEQQAQLLNEIGAALITTFDVEGLMDTLAQTLPRLGIPSSYLSIYEDPQNPGVASRLLLAYHEQGRIELGVAEQQFPSPYLLPEDLWPPDRAYSSIVEPLYFRQTQLGFVLFEVGPRGGEIYAMLREQISSALQGALLVQRVQENAAEMTRQKNILDTFMDSVPDTIYFKDLDSRMTQVNRAMADRLGVDDPADAVGLTDFDLFPEDLARPKYEQEQEIIRTGHPILALEEPDAGDRWALTTKMPLRNEYNEIIGTFGVSRDITEMKQAQKEIEQANQALEVQVWQSAGQAELNDKMRGEQDIETLSNNIIKQLCRYLNAQVGALYLAEDDHLTLVGRYAYSSKKSSEKFKFGEGVVGQAALEKEPVIITNVPDNYITVRSGLGETVPRHIMVFPFVYEGQVAGVIEMATLAEFDQTQLDFLSVVTTNIGIAFNTAQARERINELLMETQQQAEELQAQGEELRVANEELASQTETLRASEAKLKEQQSELEATNTQLEEKAAALQESSAALQEKQAILDQQNRELIVAQEELERKAKELALASKYKSEFLANMSHELRTPLNSLLILARMLADNKEGNLTEEQIESSQIIYSGGTDLLNLINDILDLSKVEAGQMVFNFEVMPLTDLVSSMRMQFDHLAEEKELDFIINLAEDLPGHIKTDPQRVKQVVKNLLSNSFKFTQEGSVSLNIYRPDSKVDQSRSELDPSQTIAISVADTGIGMTPDQQRIVFEAFQQADGSTSRRYGGTGLGLSISREMTANLGGKIEVASEPGQGTTFTLYLPIEMGTAGEIETAQEAQPIVQIKKTPAPKPAAPPPSPPAQPAEPPVPKPPLPVDDRAELTTDAERSEDIKILAVIEDDPKFAKVVYNYAHKKGFKCLIAGDGKTGLELVKSYQPEAIILDLNLPDMSGWEVLTVLKNDPATRHIPIHIMSVDDEALDAYRRGAMGYLTKPVQQESLDKAFDQIESLISRDIKTLLLVEDDANSRLSIKKLLDGSDVHISEADQGQVALELLETHSFDCMILDLSLPDMSGFEVLNKMHQNGTITRCPVIIYTGRELTPEENDELMQYADSVIVKGVKSPERLLDETALFLHRVVADMPREKQQAIKQLYTQDTVLEGKKILIVDDDMRNSFALSKLLADRGIAPKIAQNGQKALELLEEHPDIDLILMDIMMPVMDGYETTKHIRAQRQFNGLPILALTAKAMKGDREKCLEAGANDYLPKPVDIDRLFSMLRVWLYQ